MNTNHLERVRVRLAEIGAERKLSSVAKGSGIALATLWRIKEEEGYDPGYSKVQTLADYFWPPRKKRVPKEAQQVSQSAENV